MLNGSKIKREERSRGGTRSRESGSMSISETLVTTTSSLEKTMTSLVLRSMQEAPLQLLMLRKKVRIALVTYLLVELPGCLNKRKIMPCNSSS
jgi:hypothetical protein